MEAKNIDDTLIQAMREQQTGVTEAAPVIERPVEAAQETVVPLADSVTPLAEVSPIQPEETPQVEETDNKVAASPNSPIDEYGNPVEKPRLYTEEELNQRIRERLNRGHYAEQQQPQPPVQNTRQTEQTEDATEEDWRTQLRKEIRSEIVETQREEHDARWRQQEYAKQVDFESKFTTGMNKYSDFRQVVAAQPITDSMLLATRSLDNPASFIYGAAKLHPQELTRISQIGDTLTQAAEVGRLHERMVKERRTASNAPKPIESPRGDMVQKVAPNQISIDERIQSYAREKRK